MKTMMTKTGLRFTVSTPDVGVVVLSAQVTRGGTFYQWLLTREDAAAVGDMLSDAAFAWEETKRGRS